MRINRVLNYIGDGNKQYKDYLKGEINDNNEKHGYWEDYYSCGQLWYKGNYVNGLFDGYWEYYYDNGQLCSKGNYVNGKRDGYWEIYNYFGQFSSKGNYVNGKFYEDK